MNATPPHHLSQRLRVGAIGLAVVVVLIVVAGAMLGSVSRQRSAVVAGNARPDLAQPLARANEIDAEPLHAMGVAPGNDGNITSH